MTKITVTNIEITVQDIKDEVGFSISHRDILSQIDYLEISEKACKERIESAKKQIRRAVKDDDYHRVIEIAEALDRHLTRLTAYEELLADRYPEGSAELDRQAGRVGA